jgi:hypothetical protein
MTRSPGTILSVNEDGNLECPRCGWGYVHLDEVMFLSSEGSAIRAKADGQGEDEKSFTTEWNITRPTMSDRRFSVVLRGECEGGCLIDVEFAQHKGVTQVYESHAELPSDGPFS